MRMNGFSTAKGPKDGYAAADSMRHGGHEPASHEKNRRTTSEIGQFRTDRKRTLATKLL